MAFLLDGKPLPVNVPFTVGGINYPANWLRLTSKAEKEAIGITEVDDPKTYDSRFYWNDGTAKDLDDKTETKDGVEIKTLGVKTNLKLEEKRTIEILLNRYDWQVVRKMEKGIELDSKVSTYRDGIRTTYETRKTEIDNCSDTAALVNLYSGTFDTDGSLIKFNMTQYPDDPYN